MSLRAQDLLRQIRLAWEKMPYPGDDNLAGRTSGCPSEYSYIEDYFSGKHWTEITLDGLRRDYPGPEDACLSFMSPRAFRFYLPAFLSMAVQYRDQAPDSAVPALCPPRENAELYRLAEEAHREAGLEDVSNPFAPEQVRARRKWWNERTAGFGAQQRQAIVSFLEYMFQEHGDDYPATDRTLQEALDYWKQAVKS
jgi:hypothetical protein